MTASAVPMAPPAAPKSLLDSVWQEAMRAHLSGRPEITPDVLDGFVREQTGGKVKSYRDLALLQGRRQQIAGAQDVAAAGTPGPVETGLETIANAAAFGLPQKLNMPGVRPTMEAGAEAHPWVAAGSEAVGSAIPSTILSMLGLGPATKIANKLPINAFLKLAATGAMTGGVGGAAAEYAQDPSLVPNPGEMGTSALMGALVGAPAGSLGAWAAAKLNPAEHMLGQAIQRSTPDITPAFGKGIRTLEAGAGVPTRVGPPSAGVTFEPQAEAFYQRLPPELRPTNLEKDNELRTFFAKSVVPKSSTAAAQLEHGLNQRLEAVRVAKRAISNDPQTGYDALLNKRTLTPDEMRTLPPQTQHDLQGTQPTARTIFNRVNALNRSSESVFGAREMGTTFSADQYETARANKAEADALSQWLYGHDETGRENVPGLRSLQDRVAPYLQREEQLILTKRSMIGRAIKPLGPTQQQPKGNWLEGFKEAIGYNPQQITERAARQLVRPGLSTDLRDLIAFVTQKPELAQRVPALLRVAPGAGGAAIGAVTAAFPKPKKKSLLSP